MLVISPVHVKVFHNGTAWEWEYSKDTQNLMSYCHKFLGIRI